MTYRAQNSGEEKVRLEIAAMYTELAEYVMAKVGKEVPVGR